MTNRTTKGGATQVAPPGPDTLLLLSGGIDSAWCLWQRVKAGLVTRTHHVVLNDWEGRAEVESVATRRILEWMNRNGGDGLIIHTESKVDFGDIRWIPRNFYLWAYWAGTIMASPRGRSITDFVMPRHSDAFTGGPRSPGALRSDNAHRKGIALIAGREPNLVYPMVHLTKAEVVASMPKGLLALTWHCRRPKHGKPCHSCKTCKQVDAAREAITKDEVAPAAVVAPETVSAGEPSTLR